MKQPLDLVRLNSRRNAAVFLIAVSFIFPFADALEIGISPAEVSLKLIIGEEQCFRLHVFGEKDLLLASYDIWDTLPLAMSYQKQWKMKENREQHEICVSGKERGIYRGILWITDAEQKLAIGIRMYIEVEQPHSEQQGLSITGASISRNNKNILQESRGIGLLASMTLLCFVLLGLLIRMLNIRTKRKGLITKLLSNLVI